jgi:predicted porin
MKLTLPAAVALLVPLANLASAQSTVNIGGILDAGVRYDRGTLGGGSVKSVGSGQSAASRLTFSGAEDLGSGLKASFVLESGLSMDTGAGGNNPPGAATGALTFGRTSLVAVGSEALGYLSFGRQYTPLWGVSAGPLIDPFGASWLGGINTIYSATVRTSNAVGYTYGYGERTTLNPAPRVGLGVSAVWSMSEVDGTQPAHSGEQTGLGVSYGDGNWWAGYAYHRLRGSNTAVSATAPVTNQPALVQQTLAASYRFSWASLHAGLNTGNNSLTGAGAVNRRNWDVAASIPLPFANSQTLRVLYGKANDRAVANGDFKTLQIGYQYDLSKRTYLYTAYGFVNNGLNAAATPAGAQGTFAKGSSPKSLVVGLAEKF